MPEQEHFLAMLRERYPSAIPHAQETGMVVSSLTAEAAELRLPYRTEWLGDVERGLIHTGIVTTLVDSASGLAVLARLGRFDPIATLDLRMDYLRPSRSGKPIVCRAECYRLTASIAFVRASTWQDDPAEPAAVSQSVFMIGSRARKPRKGPL